MNLQRSARPTMTPIELNHGDLLSFNRVDQTGVTIELIDTRAYIIEQDYAKYAYPGMRGDISVYGFSAAMRVDGDVIEIKREVGSQSSFYEPLAIAGLHIWLDAVQCIFDTSFDHRNPGGGFMIEKDFLSGTVCMPRKHSRLVIQDASISICPDKIDWWCELPDKNIHMDQCYNGEDCWMGPYGGKFAHCGLDINMSAGTQLFAPIDFDTQYYHSSVASGFRNNSWHGFRTWDNNSIWRLSTAHLIDLLVPEHSRLEAGTPYATTAGTAVGAHEHTHFNFHITEQGGSYFLDPWILFWQMLKDNP